MKKVKLFESFLSEANKGKVHKAAKQGSYPAVVVVVQDGKVIHQEQVSTPEVAPATFNVMQKKYPKALIHLEDKTGKRLFSESVDTNEEFDGNVSDFKYEFPIKFEEETGNSSKAIKKIAKKGKGYEVRTSTYMSQAEMEKVGLALGLKLKSYVKDSRISISIYESLVIEKREDVGKYNTVKKVINKLGRRPSEQDLATFINNNYYDVTEVERGDDDPQANDKIADLVAFFKFDIDDWGIAWADAQNESVVTEAKDNLYLQLHKKYAEQIKGLKAGKIKKLTDLVSVQRWSMEDREDYFNMDSKKKKELSAEYNEERKLFKKYVAGDESVMLPKGTEELAESVVNESADFGDLLKYEDNPYGIGASSVELEKGSHGNSDCLVFRCEDKGSRDEIEKKLKSMGFASKKMTKSTADKGYQYRYELTLFESVVTEAKLKISGPAYDLWDDRDVQRKLKGVKIKIVGDIGGVATISGADDEIQKVKDILGLNESVVTEAKDNLYLQLHKKYAEQIKGLKAKKIKKLTDLVSVQRWSMEDREDYFNMDSKKKKELSAEYNEERKLFKKYIGGDESVMLPKGTEALAESLVTEDYTIVTYGGKRLSVNNKDIPRLKSGKDVVGKSLKHAGQEEWILAKGKWKIAESVVNEASEDRMIKQIERALKDGDSIFKLPMATQKYYNKNKSDFESVVTEKVSFSQMKKDSKTKEYKEVSQAINNAEEVSDIWNMLDPKMFKFTESEFEDIFDEWWNNISSYDSVSDFSRNASWEDAHSLYLHLLPYVSESTVTESLFSFKTDNVEQLHFETDPKTAELMKMELGKSQGAFGKKNQIEDAEYSLRRFRKSINYGNGKDVGVFLPGSYDASVSKLGDGPHKKAVKAVKWNQKKYDQWLEDMAANGGADNAFDMAQNAKNETGLIDWVKKNFRGDDPLQRIQWDIEGYAESVVTEAVELVHVYGEDGKMFGTGELVKTKGKKSLIRWDGSKEEWIDSKLVKLVESFKKFKDHIASINDGAGSTAEVYFNKGKGYYVVVSGEYDYDFDAKDKKELLKKLKDNEFTNEPFEGSI